MLTDERRGNIIKLAYDLAATVPKASKLQAWGPAKTTSLGNYARAKSPAVGWDAARRFSRTASDPNSQSVLKNIKGAHQKALGMQKTLSTAPPPLVQ